MNVTETIARMISEYLGENPDKPHLHGMTDEVSVAWEQHERLASAIERVVLEEYGSNA